MKILHTEDKHCLLLCAFFSYVETFQMLNIFSMSESVGDKLNTSICVYGYTIAVPIFSLSKWSDPDESGELSIKCLWARYFHNMRISHLGKFLAGFCYENPGKPGFIRTTLDMLRIAYIYMQICTHKIDIAIVKQPLRKLQKYNAISIPISNELDSFTNTPIFWQQQMLFALVGLCPKDFKLFSAKKGNSSIFFKLLC